MKRFQRKTPRRQRHIKAIQRILIAIGLGFTFDIVLFLILYIGQFGLLDSRTIISVVVPEVAIGILLYYLLGQSHRERLGEIVDMMDIYTKVSHLNIFRFWEWGAPFYYVENTVTKQAFRASDFIEKIIDQDILKPIDCKSMREVKQILRKNRSQFNEREPSLAELFDKSEKLISQI